MQGASWGMGGWDVPVYPGIGQRPPPGPPIRNKSAESKTGPGTPGEGRARRAAGQPSRLGGKAGVTAQPHARPDQGTRPAEPGS
jgi:hypothetical protein